MGEGVGESYGRLRQAASVRRQSSTISRWQPCCPPRMDVAPWTPEVTSLHSPPLLSSVAVEGGMVRRSAEYSQAIARTLEE